MTTRARAYDGVSLAIGLLALVWTCFVATEGEGRWPWVGAVIAAAGMFLLLPAPPVLEWLRARIGGRARAVALVMTGVTACALALSFAGGGTRWPGPLAYPLLIVSATWAVGAGQEGEPSPGRILLVGLSIALLAGVWDDRLITRLPGGIDRPLPYLVALGVALFLLLVARPLRSLDATLSATPADIVAALSALGALLVVALPVGYLVGFLHFNVRWDGTGYQLGRLFGLTLFVGLPEELLFRGLLQEALSRWWGQRRGWIAASIVFGLTHIVKHAPPLNWRYALLATIAGLAYGWVYARTRRLAAAALTHGLVDWVWGAFLLVP